MRVRVLWRQLSFSGSPLALGHRTPGGSQLAAPTIGVGAVVARQVLPGGGNLLDDLVDPLQGVEFELGAPGARIGWGQDAYLARLGQAHLLLVFLCTRTGLAMRTVTDTLAKALRSRDLRPQESAPLA